MVTPRTRSRTIRTAFAPAIQYAGSSMNLSHTFRLALVPGLIAAACLCWAASKPKPLSAYDPEAKALLARMTLDEKIGQMTQPDQSLLKDPADIEKYFLGSVLSGGSSDPKEGNSLKAWTDLRYNRASGLAVVCPLTSKVKPYPFSLPITVGSVEGAGLVDQIGRGPGWDGE